MLKTIEDVRLERLHLLRNKLGSVSVIFDQTGIYYAQVSQWINQSVDSKTGKPRTISSASARSIEVKLGIESDWFDQLPSGNIKRDMIIELINKVAEDALRQLERNIYAACEPEENKSKQTNGNGGSDTSSK